MHTQQPTTLNNNSLLDKKTITLRAQNGARIKRLLFSVVISSLLSACAVAPDYKRPNPTVTNKWPVKSSHVSTTHFDTTWWQQFHAPQLNRLIYQASTQNLSIQQAHSIIIQARQLRQMLAAKRQPQLQIGGTVIGNRLSNEGSVLGTFPPFGDPSLIKNPRTIYSGSFDASWELDLWGRISKQLEAADAEIEQTQFNKQAATLSVISEIAREYIMLMATRAHLTTLNRQIALQKQVLELTKQQQLAGSNNQINVETKKSQLHQLKSLKPSLLSEEYASIQSLAVLVNTSAKTISKQLKSATSLPAMPSLANLGVRSEVLRRRPDIQQAERHLAASHALIGSAIAAQYPQFTINGNLGIESLYFSNWFNTSNAIWTVGPKVSLPIYTAGRIKTNIARQKELTRLAKLYYQQKILNALSEVDSNVVSYNQSLSTIRHAFAMLASNEKAIQLSQQAYREGETDYIHVLDTKSHYLQLEQQALNQKQNALTNYVKLYKSLGGTFTPISK